VHSGIPKAYNRWYSQYKSTRVRDLIIYSTVEYLKVKRIKVAHKNNCVVYYYNSIVYCLCYITSPIEINIKTYNSIVMIYNSIVLIYKSIVMIYNTNSFVNYFCLFNF
jgi:hypothetical protein